jgi:hypothetical protein
MRLSADMAAMARGFSRVVVLVILISFEREYTFITNAVVARGSHVHQRLWRLAKLEVGERGIAHDARARGDRLAQGARALGGSLATLARNWGGMFGSTLGAHC